MPVYIVPVEITKTYHVEIKAESAAAAARSLMVCSPPASRPLRIVNTAPSKCVVMPLSCPKTKDNSLKTKNQQAAALVALVLFVAMTLLAILENL